jgi:hypothetical protein
MITSDLLHCINAVVRTVSRSRLLAEEQPSSVKILAQRLTMALSAGWLVTTAMAAPIKST